MAGRHPFPGGAIIIPKVTEARYVEGYKLWIRFSDGKSGIIDLGEELWGPMFEPLKDIGMFQHVQVHPELETLSWPNGADFAPEFLYDRVVAGEIIGEKDKEKVPHD